MGTVLLAMSVVSTNQKALSDHSATACQTGESRFVMLRGWEWGGWGVTANRYAISFWSDENIMELNSGDGCTIL